MREWFLYHFRTVVYCHGRQLKSCTVSSDALSLAAILGFLYAEFSTDKAINQMKRIVVEAMLVYFGIKSRVRRLFANNGTREILEAEFDLMLDDYATSSCERLLEKHWFSKI